MEPLPTETIDEQDILDDACITLIAGWRNGCGFVSQEIRDLMPPQIPHPLVRALWKAILHYEAVPRWRSFENIVDRAKREAQASPAASSAAKEGGGTSDLDWEVLWKRVEGARPDANGEAMRKAAKVLSDHFERVKQEQTQDELQRWGALFEREQERRQRPAASDARPLDELPKSAGRFDAKPLVDSLVLPGPSPSAPLQGSSTSQPPFLNSEGIDRYGIIPAKNAYQTLPRIEPLVEGLLRPADVSICYGKPGTKKTYAMLWLAVCAARGLPWLGFQTRPMKVVLIDKESGYERLMIRIREILNALHIPESDPLPFGLIIGPPLRLSDPQEMAKLRSKLVDYGAQLAIFDSLARTMTGDENTKKDAQLAMDGVHEFARETKIHCALIHHSPKSSLNNNGTPRGSGVFEADPDLLVEIQSADRSIFQHFLTHKVRDGKARDWWAQCNWVDRGDPEKNEFSMQRVEKPNGEGGERELSPLRQWILDYLEEKGESSLPEITAEGVKAGMGAKDSIHDAVRILAREDKIYRTNPEERGVGVKAKYATNSVNDESEDVL